METQLLDTGTPEALGDAVERAAAAFASGQVVALPTETVYGLAADALAPEALVKIFEAKERPFFDPLIVHVPDQEWLERVADIPATSRTLVAELIRRFWPGPLTMVLPRQAIVPDLVTSGLPTVAVRMSVHPVFSAVVKGFGKPVAAPSANRFGRISPTTAAHVLSELGGRIPLIVDGGATQHGVESTIVAVEGDRLRILRSGPVTAEELATVAQVEHGVREVSQPEAPGQLKSHYAPRTPMSLLAPSADVEEATKSAGVLGWTHVPNAAGFGAVEVLSPTGDLREAAATLFAKMRRLDESGVERIVAYPVPEHGLGAAIMDRLRKASAVED